jgi:type II secretory pathway pseudopilin PulG
MTLKSEQGLPRRSAARIIGAEAGMSLVEATIILSVVAVLASVLAPAVNGYVDQARQVRARNDTQVIAEAILDFVADTAERQFLIDASNGGGDETPPTRLDGNRVNLLVSDGDIPTLTTTLAGEIFWTQAVNDTTVDTLSNHLVENTPGEQAGNRYRTPADITIPLPGGNNIDFARGESSGYNAPHAWRGAYLRGPVRADPWGNRYAVNVAFMDPSPTAGISDITSGFGPIDYPRLDVFVLSAGGDKEIDTLSGQDGAVPGDDDFIFIVSSNAK